ncbi:MAG: LptF/LptG family permease, partial [Candidatus Margulisbacteria bacterium]|nr:LptF/LptG family permease [Candidatus Margulisiibacteriota bacterium]
MFRIKILDRYLAAELFLPFLFGVLAFSAITAGGAIIPGLVGDATALNLPLGTAISLFMVRMPKVIAYTFPMATLLASLLAFGSLSSNSEVTAFRAGGLSLFRLMIAPFFIGVFISFLTILFNEAIVPKATFLEENMIIRYKEISKQIPTLKENVNIPEYEGGYLKRLVYAKEREENTMKDVSVSEYDKGRFARIIFAKQAEWQKEGGWLFKDGIIHQFSGDKRSAYIIEFKKEIINIELTLRDLSKRTKDPDQMALFELGQYIEQQKKRGVDVTEYLVKYNQKFAVPFACLVFVLLGAPMGIRPQRTGGGVGFALSIVVVFGYYVLLSIGMWLGLIGALTPWLAAWMPNI